MGISKEFKLKGNDFTNAASASWIAVLFAEFPSIYLLQRMPVGRWLAACLFGWAIFSACTAASTSLSGLVTARVFSGIFEAGIPPSLMLISSHWYTKQEQIIHFVWWYLGTAGGMTVGGFVSWCFQHAKPTLLLRDGRSPAAIYILVPDTPMQARFLSTVKEVSPLEHFKINQTGVENRLSFSAAQLEEAFCDFQFWCQWLIILLEGGGGGVITTYSATLIKGFWFSHKQTTLLNMGGCAVAITVCLLTSYGVRFFGNRCLFLVLLTIPSITGAALMAYLPKSEKGGLLACIYLVSSIFAAVPTQFLWVTANVSGQTKKACAAAILNAAFAIGNPVGPQTFRAKDVPAYTPAKAAMMSFQCVIVGLSVVLYIYFRVVNKK